MSIVVENLFKRPEVLKRFFEVVKPLDGNRYLVQDNQGRSVIVDGDSSISWNKGDSVTVSNMRIVGRAAKFRMPKVYEV